MVKLEDEDGIDGPFEKACGGRKKQAKLPGIDAPTRFEQAIQRQERIDSTATLVMASMAAVWPRVRLDSDTVGFREDEWAERAYDAAEALERARTRRLMK